MSDLNLQELIGFESHLSATVDSQSASSRAGTRYRVAHVARSRLSADGQATDAIASVFHHYQRTGFQVGLLEDKDCCIRMQLT